TGVVSGTLDVTTLTATSLGDPSVTGSAREHTTVRQSFGSSLSPRFVELVEPGETLEFRHTLVNIGNALDTFAISATATLPWPLTVSPGSTTLGPSAFDSFITLRVQVPADAPLGAVNRITVTAASRGGPGHVSAVEHVMALPPLPQPKVEYPAYLPVIWR
ncbi:MAG TPA: hypothetical protein VNL77_22565, partial [Roseiflexaceae bacterium]|nr:hypothetical protein [Roseiflexaceae bacterium]